MSGLWRERLQAERRKWLVGREAERALWEKALAEPAEGVRIFYVFGPGGVGKTTLLQEWKAIAESRGATVIFVDGRSVGPHTGAFLEAISGSVGAPGLPVERLWDQLPRPIVLFIDTYEALRVLEGWLKESFLPNLPVGSIVAIASRYPPSLAWRADPGWGQWIQAVPLRNLSPEESSEYLRRRGIPEAQHRAAFSLTWGHPLALALVADFLRVRPDQPLEPEMASDLFRSLLHLFLEEVPTPAHRRALEACALVRLVTEPLLAEIVGEENSEALFDWLRNLSFMEAGPYGLRPHDIVREAILADLRWRNPERYRELHRKAQAYYARRLNELSDPARMDLLVDYVYLHRHHPLLRPFFIELRMQWPAEGALFLDRPKPSEREEILEIIATHEGEISAHIAERWINRQPDGVIVVRDAQNRIAGLLISLSLEAIEPREQRGDPAIAAAFAFMERQAPLRPGERALYFRFWMARSTYQALSPAQSLIGLEMVRLCLVTPRLAYSFFPCADPEFWAPLFAYAGIPRLPEADFEVGGRRYGVYGQDWRKTPIPLWLARLGEKEAALGAAESPPPPEEPIVVLNFPEFREAVRQALRDLHRPDRLAMNPLARSRLVLMRTGPQAPAERRGETLRALLLDAIQRLQASPKDARRYQALYHTYVEPAGSQEQIAERLNLPLSTYRRYLQKAIDQITSWLWEQELGP